MANTCKFRNSDKSLKLKKPTENGLIPGLPDDMALECLVRVPINSYPTLRLVSHGWKLAISLSSFYSDRRHVGSSERLVFLIQPLSPSPPPPQHQLETDKSSESIDGGVNGGGGPPLYNLNVYNLTRRQWQTVARIEIPTFSHCVVVPTEKKVVVLGGWDPSTLEPVSRVLVIDLVTGTWKEGSPMPTARSFFACALAGPATIYVAGGHDGQKNALRSAEAYDVVSDRWWALPDMSEERDESQGIGIGIGIGDEMSRFWVVSGYGTESQGRFRSDAEVYDPETNSWSRIEGVWPFPATTPKATAIVGRRRRWLFVKGEEVREFNWEEKRWEGVNSGGVPKSISQSGSVGLIDVGDEIEGRVMVMGNGEKCGGEGVFMLELGRENEDKKSGATTSTTSKSLSWKHVDVPCRFMGFPFSASQLLI